MCAMLVLTRKKDQALVIGDDIEITVLDIQGDQIRLGVEAPKNVKIFRKELYLEILEENKNAAKPAARVQNSDIKNILQLTKPDAK
jgi:carbon storage regulator